MIIVRAHAGLGNQLFQYACGRALALRLGVELRIYDGPEGSTYGRLWDFTVAATRATEQDLAQARFTAYENPFGFLPQVLGAPDGIYLDGLWQSEKYFADAADAIRADLSLVDTELALRARVTVDELRQQTGMPVVAVHVRRGDYLLESTKGFFHVPVSYTHLTLPTIYSV